jgi:hypothetical protein
MARAGNRPGQGLRVVGKAATGVELERLASPFAGLSRERFGPLAPCRGGLNVVLLLART